MSDHLAGGGHGAREDVGAQHTLQASAARLELAARLRRLSHAVVAHELDEDAMLQMSSALAPLEVAANHAEPRRRPVDAMKRDLFSEPPPDGGIRSHFPDCVVSGPANPMGIDASVRREGEEGVLRVTLGAAFEGAPGRAHGGVVAALFDEAMGFVLSIACTPAYTGRLSVIYKAPTPLGVPLQVRARLRERQGRKLIMSGELRDEMTLIAEAEGLFISVDPERFATGGGRVE